MTFTSRARSLARGFANRVPLLVDLYRMGVNPRWEIANWRDWVSTYRGLVWLRQLPDPTPGSPRSLLVLRREDIFDIKCRAMLGAALKLEGAQPVILANHRRVPRILRYARAFGIDEIRYRDEFRLTLEELSEISRLTAELMSREMRFASVRDWTHRGHKLGERILSTLIRETLDGEPDLTDPAVEVRMRRIVLRVLAHYREAEKVFDAVRPSWVLADETGYATNGPLVDVALSRGVDVFEVTPFLRDGTLLFKRMNSELGRAPAASVSMATLDALAERPWTSDQEESLMSELEERYAGRSGLQRMYQWHTEHTGREEICREFDLDPQRPIAVVFSHVLWDSSFFYGRDLFLSYRTWLEETLHAAVANPRVNWLIKTHPSNAFRLRHGDVSGPVAEVEVVRRSVSELPEHVRLVLPETRVSSLSLFRHTDVGITVRSTAGLEMACFGKPVITAGTGHYSGLGFTHDADTAEEYLERLRRVTDHLRPLDEDQTIHARRYAHALMRLRPWTLLSFETQFEFPHEGWHPLDRNLVPTVRSLAEAEAHGDLRRWATWAVRSPDADYLEEDDPAERVARPGAPPS